MRVINIVWSVHQYQETGMKLSRTFFVDDCEKVIKNEQLLSSL